MGPGDHTGSRQQMGPPRVPPSAPRDVKECGNELCGTRTHAVGGWDGTEPRG